MNKIFLDLDGVMADFEGYFLSHFGFKHDAVDDKTMWHYIDNHKNFFGNLPLMEGARELLHEIVFKTGKLPFVLTACPRTNYFIHATQKIEWVHKHLHPNIHVLPVMGGKNKALFMDKPGDLLIDDFDKNLKPWIERGGKIIHHKNSTDTIAILKAMDLN